MGNNEKVVVNESVKSKLDSIESGAEAGTKRPSLDDIETGNFEFIEKPAEEVKKPEASEIKTEAAKIEPAVAQEKVIEQPPQKTYKLKVDGVEMELTEEEVIKYAQMGKASHKRFDEAAAIKRQVEPILKALKEDPYYLLTHPEMGVDEGKLREATEKWLAEKIMFEQMTPEQQELHALRKERETAKQREKEQIRQQEQQRIAEMEKKYSEEYERQFLGALEKVNVPKEARVVARMAEYMARAVKTNTPLSAEEAAMLVKEDIAREQATIASKLNPEELVNFIGKDNADKIRKYFASQVKNVLAEEGSKPRESAQGQRKREAKWDNGFNGFRSYLDKLEGF